MAVRVDADGIVRKDFHTAQDVIRADGSGRAETVVSTRYYLSDASFLVGLETADRALLDRLDSAIRHPVWPLSLGRKSFVPGQPVALEGSGVVDGQLLDILRDWPPVSGISRRYVVDVPYGSDPTAEPRFDLPVSFAHREFRTRHVRVDFFPPIQPATTEAKPCS
jgi:CRISPR system Cascade subunit CasD